MSSVVPLKPRKAPKAPKSPKQPKAIKPHPKPQPTFRPTFIRQWRKSKGLTIEQLAERVQMVPSNLSMLERGLRGYTQATLESIAEALGTEAASLLMRNPTDKEAPWSIYENLKPAEKEKALEYINMLKVVSGASTGTDG